MQITTIGILALALLVRACGNDSTSATPEPRDADSVVLTVTSEGGFVPVEFNLDRMPRFVLMGDGRLYSPGMMTLEFPGKLLPPVQVTTISDEQFGEIMALVEELGLPDIDEEIDNSNAEMVADASTEFITYYDPSGSVHRLGVYALGLVEGGSDARFFAAELVQALEEAAATGESQIYQPERLQVAAGPAVQVDPAIQAEVKDWPLAMSHEEMEEWGFGWRCVEVTDDEVGPLFEVFGEANQATLWDTGTEQLTIKARPLLPGETACSGKPETA